MVNIPFLSSKRITSFPRPGRLKAHFSSRARSLDIDREIINYLLSQYEIELAGKSKNLPNARRNTNLVIDTVHGKKILKNYRPDWKASTIEFEHSILEQLRKTNFPAPRLVPLKNGNTWLSVEGMNYCLFDFIQGKNYSSSYLFRPHRVRMMATSGRMLASLHKQLIGFQPTGQHHLGFKSLEKDRIRNIPWISEKIKELVRDSRQISEEEDKRAAEWLIRHSDELFDNLVLLDEKLTAANLTPIIIHGDYGLHNLIYTDVDHAVPVDYELSRIEWRMSDLVSVLGKFRYKGGRYDFESITQFLHAYQKEYAITPQEWDLFPDIWKYYKLRKAVQYWISYFETSGPVRKLRSSRKEIERSDWAMENPARLSDFRRVQ